MNFQLADLTTEQKQKLKDVEEELDLVLIAWDKENMTNEEYDQRYENDRI